jgi:iron transport multicopper oxidase
LLIASYDNQTNSHLHRINLGNASYVSPKVPTLYTSLTTGTAALNPTIYGSSVNPYIIKTGQVVQIIVENHDDTEHPMHLHGYEFQVVARGAGTWDGDESKLPKVPMRRDTVTTPASGYLVIRIKANNPGVWMFHCHMEFHGMFPHPRRLISCPTSISPFFRFFGRIAHVTEL